VATAGGVPFEDAAVEVPAVAAVAEGFEGGEGVEVLMTTTTLPTTGTALPAGATVEDTKTRFTKLLVL